MDMSFAEQPGTGFMDNSLSVTNDENNREISITHVFINFKI